jgi:hypothetical protein
LQERGGDESRSGITVWEEGAEMGRRSVFVSANRVKPNTIGHFALKSASRLDRLFVAAMFYLFATAGNIFLSFSPAIYDFQEQLQDVGMAGTFADIDLFFPDLEIIQ